ncbi:MAG: PD-(D/E)XK nuclease family protein [Acidobacteria bacterium]|nr:PD-(D/E)XK nuclease family protein [Acidobacteriota bacterium]
MSGHECYHCKQWVEEGEAHECLTTIETGAEEVASRDEERSVVTDAVRRVPAGAVPRQEPPKGPPEKGLGGGGHRVVISASAAVRLREARAFLDAFTPGTEILLLGASRRAVDDVARGIGMENAATFGLHRLSFTQLAARLAAASLASRGWAPASTLGHEAVAARASSEAAKDEALKYLLPVSSAPGFPKALAHTLLDLRLAGVSANPLTRLPQSGPDLAGLLDRLEELMVLAGVCDRASLFDEATRVLTSPDASWLPMPTLLLDVPFDSEAEAQFLWAVIERSPQTCLTIPDGDLPAITQVRERPLPSEFLDEDEGTDLTRLTRHLFRLDPPPEREPTGELVWFSAPGEGRECVEIARRILVEAAAGVRFDEMAVLVRSPPQYQGVLEHALARARIPAYFDSGVRRPHPAGRAFLAMLNCCVENFSAKRFAEYLSLAQVPLNVDGRETWVESRDEVLSAQPGRSPEGASHNGILDPLTGASERSSEGHETDVDPSAIVSGTLRAPWKWESLLVESAVIGGSERWVRRLDGLAEQYRLMIRELKDDDPDSARIPHIERELANLQHLRAFALPLVEHVSDWPDQATWGDWLRRLEGFAPRVLRTPEHLLRVLADLRPMATVGPVSLAEVRDVLSGRLLSLAVEPPADRYGSVFVGSPHQVRGRAFRVVFAPGLAERLFPQKPREDPLLLDELRHELTSGLAVRDNRAERERLLLRLTVGAVTDRLYASFPRIESSKARSRVPSFYALEIMRAITGRVPDRETLERMAASESQASLAWPAPAEAMTAIDPFEHDLSVLRRLMFSTGEVKGHAHYMLTLNECLKRSVTERWARARRVWSKFDGLVRVTDRTRPFLEGQRLTARPYSVSALQLYAACPYRFFLSAAYGLAPLKEAEPLQRMDPLTKGRLVHQVQAEFFRAVQREQIDIAAAQVERVLDTLDETLTRIAADYYQRLSPAIDRVWHDEIAAIRTDLRVWVDQLASHGEWKPWLLEFAFGLLGHAGHDPKSLRDPITIDGRFVLRGAVDLVERKPGTRILRVTDHKTSKNRSPHRWVIDGGTQLQPVLYSLAVEEATGCSVEAGRISYCTSAGGFTDHVVPMDDRVRRTGIEVLEIVDRAVEFGMLPPAPTEEACTWCDFLPVCGPDQERRVKDKPLDPIGDLLELRGHR